ncbi:MAG: NADPH:quinone reductase [Pyrinomonadaceae bacterium]|nr:NADPH:quinone reductase [Pyrinomonadaceae bacterium]MDW8304662.1 NADPH:quinone reductase [Acidobacteriota bacterium]
MKAIVVREFGDPEVMKLEEVPMPEVGASQVLVRIKAAGVNPVDTYIRSGWYPSKPSLPYTPGKDGAGIVEAIGEKVNRFKPGDRVFLSGSITGTYAEFALCDESEVHHLPENISFEEGAGVFIPYATAYRALFQKAKASQGESVLIHGASGGVGIAAIQWAKNAGLKVIGTAGSEEGRKLVKAQGADFVFDHSKESYSEEVLQVVPEGINIVLEMLANVNLIKDLDLLSKFGRIVVIGSRGSLDFAPRLIMTKDAVIFGMSLFNASSEEMNEIINAIEDGLKRGFLKPVVGKKMPLELAYRAHHEVIEKKAYGKIVLIP